MKIGVKYKQFGIITKEQQYAAQKTKDNGVEKCNTAQAGRIDLAL